MAGRVAVGFFCAWGVGAHAIIFGAFSSDTFYIDCCISALYLSTSQVLSIHSMPSSDDIAILIEAAKSRVASAEVRVVSAEQDLTSARSYLSSLENQFDLQFQQVASSHVEWNP